MPTSLSAPSDAGAAANPKTPAWLPKEFSLEKGTSNGIPEQMQRALAVAAYFLSGAVAINTSQLLAAPMSAINNDWYEGWLSLTKQSFGILTTTMTQFWAPTVMRVSGDASVRGQLAKSEDGDLVCDFPDRLVLIANHQIYTDWLYLWWVAYTAGKHGNVYIVLKESLKKIPVIGWGMQLNKFIFLKRNWEADKLHLSEHMQRLNKLAEPMWLMLFPEGTNLAPDTRIKSCKWAAKNHLKDMQHTLLPRATGLRFCLRELRSSVGWVYDCTVAYSGVPRGKFAQDIYTLRASYLEGRPPKSVNMYWRRFKISDIPLDNPLAFESWLLARWREKDNLIEYFYKHGRFPADKGLSMGSRGEFLRGAGHIESEVRASKWKDFLQVFAPIGILALVLFMFYGALPGEMIDAIGGQAGRIGQQVENKVGSKKLLAFDGTGFKQISVGSKEFEKTVKESLSRPPMRRAPESVSSMSSGPRGRAGSVSSASVGLSTTGSSVAQPQSRGAQSTTKRQPKQRLGFVGGIFREVNPVINESSSGTDVTNGKVSATSAAATKQAGGSKPLGFTANGYLEASKLVRNGAAASSQPKTTSQSTPQPPKNPAKTVALTQQNTKSDTKSSSKPANEKIPRTNTSEKSAPQANTTSRAKPPSMKPAQFSPATSERQKLPASNKARKQSIANAQTIPASARLTPPGKKTPAKGQKPTSTIGAARA